MCLAVIIFICQLSGGSGLGCHRSQNRDLAIELSTLTVRSFFRLIPPSLFPYLSPCPSSNSTFLLSSYPALRYHSLLGPHFLLPSTFGSPKSLRQVRMKMVRKYYATGVYKIYTLGQKNVTGFLAKLNW